jgi:predicted porin
MARTVFPAVIAASILALGLSTNAQAADLGGNCCADLEERIAELEATTARKGNRKVSLTVSGWVAQQISFWDDGTESNVYVHDLGTTLGSHVKFTGSATITAGWSAGYVLQIEGIGSDGLTTSQAEPVGPPVYAALGGNTNGAIATVLQSYWFVKSDQLGKVSVGKQSQASDNTAILVDGSGSLVPANWVAFDTNSFALRIGGVVVPGTSWGNAQSCNGMGGAWGDCNGLTQNVIRYDSPTFAGFSVSASWGEDDMWDVAARYAGEHAGFKIAVAAAYNETSDQDYNNLQAAGILPAVPDADYFQVGVYVQHVQSGLFGLYNFGTLDVDLTSLGIAAATDSIDTHYVKAGVRTKLNALGATVFYGEYLNGQDGLNIAGIPIAALSGAGLSSELEVWGLGIVQEVDAAAMSVWLKYRNLSLELDAGGAPVEFDDFDYVGVGALINF